MKINVVAALAGGLIIGAGSMVPLGSFAQSDTPALNATPTAEQTVVPADPNAETPATVLPVAPTPPVPITPPSFGAGDKVDDDDDDVEYEDDDYDDDEDDDDEDHEDEDHEDEDDD
jgi:hypothetical protein